MRARARDNVKQQERGEARAALSLPLVTSLRPDSRSATCAGPRVYVTNGKFEVNKSCYQCQVLSGFSVLCAHTCGHDDQQEKQNRQKERRETETDRQRDRQRERESLTQTEAERIHFIFKATEGIIPQALHCGFPAHLTYSCPQAPISSLVPCSL